MKIQALSFAGILMQIPFLSEAAIRTPVQLQQWDTSCIQEVADPSEDTFLLQDFIQKLRAEITRFDGTPRQENIQYDVSESNSRRRLEPLLAGISRTYLLNGHRCIRSTISQLVDLSAALPDVEAVSHPLTVALVSTLRDGYNIESALRLFRLGWSVLGRARAKKDPTLTDDAEMLAMGAIRGLAKQHFQDQEDAVSAAPIFLDFLSAGVAQRGRRYPESAYTVIILPALERLMFLLPQFEKPETDALGKALLDQTMANIKKAVQQALTTGPVFFGNGYNTDILTKGIDVLSNIHCYVGATNEVKTLIEGIDKVFAGQKMSPPRLAVAKTRFAACNPNTTGHYFSFVTEDPHDQL